jgi:hypothetical protein
MKAKTTRSVTEMPASRPSAAGSRGTAAVEDNDSSVRAIFLRRMRRWTRDLARSAPSSLLADALSQPSARGTMVHLLSVFAPSAEETEAQQLRERALERTLVVQEEVREAAGGFRSTAWVADHLKIRRQSVDKRRKEGRLLAQETPAGYVFPACQFSAEGTVPGLDEVLDALAAGSFWETLAALVTPSPALEGRTVIESLQTARSLDDRQRVVAVARAYASA